MLQVYELPCQNCLLSKDRIVSNKRAIEIIKGCKKDQTYFVCHKASMNGKEIVCHTFYKTLGFYSQLIRIAERLNAILFVKHENNEKLTPYKNE